MTKRTTLILAALAAAGFLTHSGPALAQAGGECSGGVCGTPQTSGGGGGGGGCGCGGGSILINNTDEGDTYQYADDYDDDGIEDDFDNCPFVQNRSQTDSDGDAYGDACDICPGIMDENQLDTDGDGSGDACDTDADNDGIVNDLDNCPLTTNIEQIDTDSDKTGDACDIDDDDDGVEDISDNCPLVSNPLQKNADPNSFGDACDRDDDKDNIDNTRDNCPQVANPDQRDNDEDGTGDACDIDLDNDGIVNLKDNCPELANAQQTDGDRDGKGDACDGRFCFVVNGDEKNCLDPQRTFSVYSPTRRVRTGESFRLRIFANRQSAVIRYKWIIAEHPGGSVATVHNPRGTVRVSTPFEYHYLKGNVATFTADEPGEYKIKLAAELVFADVVNPNFPRENSYVMSVIADGDSMGGCALAPGNGRTGLTVVIIGLFVLIGLALRRWLTPR